jgi:hypothetical protein
VLKGALTTPLDSICPICSDKFASMNSRLGNQVNEIEGCVKLGMKREALKLARRTLKQTNITAKNFNDALDAVLIQADKLKAWTMLVEGAYARLPERDQKSVRFMLMSFRHCNRHNEGVLQLLPRHFTGEFALCELAYAMDAAMSVNKMELAATLARRLPWAIRSAEKPTMQTVLRLNLAEFFTRTGKWDEAIAILETVCGDNVFCRDAVVGVAEIHIARALLAIKHGFELVGKFNRNFDANMETTLPGNDKKIRQQAETQFRKWQKILGKVVPEKRRKELRLDG